jgi:hypothetical protein
MTPASKATVWPYQPSAISYQLSYAGTHSANHFFLHIKIIMRPLVSSKAIGYPILEVTDDKRLKQSVRFRRPSRVVDPRNVLMALGIADCSRELYITGQELFVNENTGSTCRNLLKRANIR